MSVFEKLNFWEDNEMSTKKVRIRTAAQMRKQIADKRTAKKAKRVTVRELIELLAKCDWDSEVTCISNCISSLQFKSRTKNLRKKITAVSYNAQQGTQILFENS